MKQRRQKIPFFVSFLVLCVGAVLLGIFGPESQFSDNFSRSEPTIGGAIGTVTSTIWYFFGSIDWPIKKAREGSEN